MYKVSQITSLCIQLGQTWHYYNILWYNRYFQCLDAVLSAQEEKEDGHGEENDSSSSPPCSPNSQGSSQCVEGGCLLLSQ